ncbi:MAG: hypothetical protein JW924_03435 [Fusobacteriaceae bacterium]|nr:hypothetical protein [Fusobacteriaceae bacterium]
MLRSDYRNFFNESDIVSNEVPTKLTSKKFRTSYDYKSGSLLVFLNGIKELEIVENSDNEFSFKIDTIIGDTVEVTYLKK